MVHMVYVFLSGAIVGYLSKRVFDVVTNNQESVNKLKNALLAHAMMCISPVCNDLDYTGYEGGILPPFSGCSVENACFTYFSDGGSLNTRHMLSKLYAINKYVQKNLNTDEAVYKFFVEYMKYLSNKSG
jgi:hypothetical protein